MFKQTKYLSLRYPYQHLQPFAARCLGHLDQIGLADVSSSSAIHCQSGSRTRPAAFRIFRLPKRLCSWREVLLDGCLLP